MGAGTSLLRVDGPFELYEVELEWASEERLRVRYERSVLAPAFPALDRVGDIDVAYEVATIPAD